MKSTAYWQSGLKEEKIKTRGRHYSMPGQATLAAPFWVLTQSQALGYFRSEGLAVNIPDREGGNYILLIPEARRAGTDRGAPSALRQLPIHLPCPKRTGLLTVSPSDLSVLVESATIFCN
jgi:hypothetical protein